MDQLPPEIVATIFSKVTLKTLTQCRRVCKSWLAVLSDPATLRSHIKLPKCLLLHINPKDTCSSTNSRFLYLYDHRDIPSPDNAVLKLVAKTNDPKSVTTQLVGSSNGMLCWCRKVPTGELYQFRVTIYISNPLTGESMTIPSGTDYYNQCSRIGFGFIPNQKKYKLVHLVTKTTRTDELEAKVLTLGSGIWKCVKCPYKVRASFGVYAKGALHWMDHDDKICFFDLETEQFGTLPSPSIARTNPLLGMTVIKDWITVWCKVDNPKRRVQIWMMMEYGVESSWLEFKARSFSRRVRLRGVKLKYGRPLIFYPKQSLILCSPKTRRSLDCNGRVQHLCIYHPEHAYSLVAMPFGNIDEAVPGFVPTFLSMETLLKGS